MSRPLPISPVIQKRYKFTDYAQLCHRVAACVDPDSRHGLADLMLRREFIPAGNTLLAGVHPIRPNCSILGALTDDNYAESTERAETLWRAIIGIGFRFDRLSRPAHALRDLSARNAAINIGFRAQRGNMGVLDIEHAALGDFLAAKDASVYNFNISVAASDAFMTRALVGDRAAVELLRLCARSAHAGAEPGIVFIDRVQPTEPTPYGRIETLVPCGEQGMFADETCNLGSINLAACSVDALEDVVSRAVHILDNVVDLLDIPDARMRQRTREMRRIGLGIMGFAEMLAQRNISYGSADALALVNQVGARFQRAARAATEQLARTRGGLWFNPRRRNITTTCIAPTGGITLLTGHAAFAFEPFFDEASSLSTAVHLDMLATWQRYIENSVSKTINMPAHSTPDDVLDVFLQAYQRGCKSVTIYRDGSRTGQPIACGAEGGSCQ